MFLGKFTALLYVLYISGYTSLFVDLTIISALLEQYIIELPCWMV